MEQELRIHRDQAIKLLQENYAQSREGVDLLVQDRLTALATAARSKGARPSGAEMEALYQEVLDLSYTIFSLGYAVGQTMPQTASKSR